MGKHDIHFLNQSCCITVLSGTPAFDKLQLILGNTRLETAIKKLSPDAQTSCLEGFHATLNYWHLKMLCFS